MKRFILGGVLCFGVASLSIAQYPAPQPPAGGAQPPGGGFGGQFGGGPPGGGFGGGQQGGGFGGRGGGMGGPGFNGGGGRGGGMGGPGFNGGAGMGGFGGGMGGPGFGGNGGGRGGMGGGQGGGMGGRGFDPGMLFDRMAGGKPTIDVNTYSNPWDKEAGQKMRDFMAKKGNSSGQMTKELYIEHFNEQMAARMRGAGGPGGGPGGGGAFGGGPGGGRQGMPGMGMGGQPGFIPQGPSPEDMAKDKFRQFDKNSDSILQADEQPDFVKQDLAKIDVDKNGNVELEEYVNYFKAKFSALDQENHPPFEDELEKRPTIYRAGKLPKDMPSWFETLDKDKDGQVGLYEWKTDSSKTSDEFRLLDFNGDGFITIDECLRNNRILAKKAGITTGGNDTPTTPSLPVTGVMDKKEGGNRGTFFNKMGGNGERKGGGKEDGGGGGRRGDKRDGKKDRSNT